MNKKGRIIGIGIIVLAIGFLVVKGLDRSMMTYVEVSQIESVAVANTGGTMQINGIVKPGTVKSEDGSQLVTFVLQDLKNEKFTIPVRYEGIMPDNFKPGLQVVVQGKITGPKRIIEAEKILVKCPSKYEAVETNKKI